MYESVLPKYLALTFDRFYEMPHGVDEDLASSREGEHSLDLGIKIVNFFPPANWFRFFSFLLKQLAVLPHKS